MEIGKRFMHTFRGWRCNNPRDSRADGKTSGGADL
jgi:hypothetical protein